LLPGNIAYLGIHSFNTDTASTFFRNNYETIARSSAMIIDLRENGGGNTDLEILSYLIDSAASVSKMYTRQYIAAHRPWRRLQTTWGTTNGIQPNGGKRYTKPVILLVSPRTYSAAEDFAVAFKTLKCGLIMGEATGGSTGQPLFITLPGNISARICTKRDQFPNGDEFIGKGVLPDIPVTPTVQDIRKGIDTELQAALKEVKKLAK
jgi:C-terminal processing protease CtpA/Prc